MTYADGMTNYARKIKSLRTMLGLSQEQLAARWGVSQGTISRWEQGQQVPTYTAIERIAELTGEPIDQFAPDAVRQAFGGSWGRQVPIVGSIGSLVTDYSGWQDWHNKEITIPNVPAWKNLSLECMIVEDNSMSDIYPRNSLIIYSPYTIGLIRPKSGDRVIFEDKISDQSARYSVRRLEIIKKDSGIRLDHFSDGVIETIHIPNVTPKTVSGRGGYRAFGLRGLVVGSFTIEDPARIPTPPNPNESE